MEPLGIPVWKREEITMDFITKLPQTTWEDSIWVIMDRLKKSDNFIPIKYNIYTEKLTGIYIQEVVARHGVPVLVVSDQGVRFTSRFWKRFHEELGTRLYFNMTFHPQVDGQSEGIIQTLGDMLWDRVLEFSGSWDTYLSLVKFSYNNSYHSSIYQPPFEMLYMRKCQTPIVGVRSISES